MEGFPVSAFSVYRANKSKNKVNKDNKKKRRNQKYKSNHPHSRHEFINLSEEVICETVTKLKGKQRKIKETKKKPRNNKSTDFKNSGNDNDEKELCFLHKRAKAVSESTNGGHKVSKSDKKSIVTESNKKSRKESLSFKNETDMDSEGIPELIPAHETYRALSESSCSHSEDSWSTFVPVHYDSTKEALKVFKWMVAPYDPNEFFHRIWEKKPLHIARNKPTYYNEIISTPIIDNMLRTENIQFTKNIDITSYVNNIRETHNPEGRAYPHMVWDFYLNGCSIRLLNPQTYIQKLHLMNATLQEYFNSFVGANAYLTPPDSQGFAPHYDDIEAFILQAEGKKHWKIYKPRTIEEILPRYSSKNFNQDEIGEPVMEVTLEAGDMLYFPRGYIHQGVTIDGEHSLHVTISMYQKHSWADLFEKLIPVGLQRAIDDNVEFRRGLPLDLYDNFGFVNTDVGTPRRQELFNTVISLFEKIKNYLPIDDAVDQMHKNYQHDALPPVLSDLEKAVTVHGDSDVMTTNGKVVHRVEISLDTKIRLLRKNIVRMVVEDTYKLYYHVENSLEYHGNDLTFIEIEDDCAPAIEGLIKAYPEYIAVENLDLAGDSEKLDLADALWSRGLVMTEYPLENIDDD